MDTTRKRGKPDAAASSSNGGFKKSRQEMDSLASGVGSKSKPCTKFYSKAGCPFGEGCHFLHYVPGGYNAVAQIMNRPSATPKPKNLPPPQTASNGSSTPQAVKNRMCKKYNTAEGCKFGDKCHFAHGEWELGMPAVQSHSDHSMTTKPLPGHMISHISQPPWPAPTAGFGTATVKITIGASLAGAIIGNGGANTMQICRLTGAKLSIREHISDPNLRNVELEGTFEQIGLASEMVKDLIAANIGPAATGGGGGEGPGHVRKSSGEKKHHPGSNYKTKICDNFVKGSCSFGERCHFAHGAAEMRKAGV